MRPFYFLLLLALLSMAVLAIADPADKEAELDELILDNNIVDAYARPGDVVGTIFGTAGPYHLTTAPGNEDADNDLFTINHDKLVVNGELTSKAKATLNVYVRDDFGNENAFTIMFSNWPANGPGANTTGNFNIHQQVETEARLQDVDFGDIDGDGDLDALISTFSNSEPAFVYVNDGSGNFSFHQSLQVTQQQSAIFHDFDQDGDLDAILATVPGVAGIQIWENDGNGNFIYDTKTIVGNYPTNIFPRDMDADGYIDMVLLDGKFLVSKSDGAEFYQFAYSVGQEPVNSEAGVVADFDGDKSLDFVQGIRKAGAGADQSSVLWINDGSENFSESTQEFAQIGTYGMTSGDFNGDGSIDIVEIGLGTNGIWLHTNDGAGNFTSTSILEPNGGGYSIASADFDGDMDLDLIYASATKVQAFVNDGNGNFTASIPEITGVIGSGNFGLGDIDGDGDIDVALARDDRLLILKNEKLPLTVDISFPDGDYSNKDPLEAIFTFSEPVQGFAADDIDLSNGLLQEPTTTDNQSYSVMIFPEMEGSLDILLPAGVVTDLDGEDVNLESDEVSVIVDRIAPTAVITFTEFQTESPISFQMEISEEHTGMGVNDFHISNGGGTRMIMESPTTYTFTVIPSASGLVEITWKAGAIKDLAKNPNEEQTFSIEYDGTGPIITMTSTEGNPTKKQVFEIEVTVDEANEGFLSDDVSVTGGTVTNFTIMDTQDYVIEVTADAPGLVTITIAGEVIFDPWGNGNLTTALEVTYAPNQAPAINGLVQPISIEEDDILALALEDLDVTDDDNTFPDDFTMHIGDGQNYNVDHQIVIPDTHFNGILSIPVTVNDGFDDSEVVEIEITVTPINDAPEITGQVAVATDEDMNLTLDLTQLIVTDVDNTFPGDFTLTAQSGDNYSLQGLEVIPDPNYYGALTIPVTINDGVLTSEVFDLNVTVNSVNDVPIVVTTIDDLTVDQGFGTTTVDLANVFADIEGDALTLSATSADQTIATVAVNGNDLTITEVGAGVITITVAANDGNGGEATTEFTLTINMITSLEEELRGLIRIYPNPVESRLFLSVEQSIDVSDISLYSLSGIQVPIAFGGQHPGKYAFDLEALPAGIYLLKVTAEEGSLTQRIIKR